MNKKGNTKSGSIGVVGATSIGVGGMMGAGLYTLLGLAAKSAGVWLPISFLVGGFVAAFSVYSYAKLGMKYPDRGGAAKFLLNEFGDGLLAGGLNIFQYLGWIVAMALYATGFSEYMCDLLGLKDNSVISKLIAVGVVLVVVLINLLGSKGVTRSQTVIVSFELVILFAFIVIGLLHFHLPVIDSKTTGEGFFGILSAAGLLYVTYEGFGVVTNAAGSMKNPKKQLPRALFLSLGIVMLIYILASTIVISTIGVNVAVKNQGHVLDTAALALFGEPGKIAIGLAALVATASAVNATMFGDNNLAIRISKVDEIPHRFGAMTKVGGTWGLFLTALLVCLFIVIFPLSSVGEMASLSFLLVYAMVNVGHLRISKLTGAKNWILVCSIILNFGLFILLYTQTILNGEVLTWASIIVLIVASFVIEYIWRIISKQNTHWLGKKI